MANSDRQSSKQPPWHQAPDLESVSFGKWLRHQREARSIDLREIADHTKISIRYLEALESNRFDVLPAPVFTKGFLRQYGRYIGLDPDQVVNTYLNARQEGDASESEEPATGQRRASNRAYGGLLVVAVAVLIALVGYLTFVRNRGDRAKEETRPPIAAPPVTRPEPLAADVVSVGEAESAPLVVTLDFVDDSWLETVVDGERQLSEQVGKGESRRIFAQETVVLTLGNRDGVLVDVNGSRFDVPTSENGETVVEIALSDLEQGSSEDAPEDSM